MKVKIIIIFLFISAFVVFGQGVMFQHILIDAGHGGPALNYKGIGAPGMNGNEKPNEADINLQVAKVLESMLLNQLATVIMTRTEDVPVDNKDRAALINKFKPNAAVSIHFNSSRYSFVQGTETIYYCPWVSYSLAYCIHNELLKQGYLDFGIRKRPGLVVLNSVHCHPESVKVPLVLVEPLYISNTEGWNKMTFQGGVIGAQEIATHISNGLIHFFNQDVTVPPRASLGYELTNVALRLLFSFTSDKRSVIDDKGITYMLYSSDDPNKNLADWNLEITTTSSYWETTVNEARKFYRLKCISNSDNENSLSEILEVFKFDCENGINWITIPDLSGNLCSGDHMTFASDLMGKFSDIESVSQWDSEKQGWVTAFKTVEGVVNDFVLEERHPYSINATNSLSIISIGYFERNAVFNLKPGVNFITLPLNKSNLSNTSLFGSDIETCNYILEWDPVKKLSRISTNFDNQHGWDFPFNTIIGNPYMVNVGLDQIWPNDKTVPLNSYNLDAGLRSEKPVIPNIPRKILCKIVDENLSSLQNIDLSDFVLKSYITTRKNEIQESTKNIDCFMSIYENDLVGQLNLGNFRTQWEPSDSVFIEVKQISTGDKGSISVALDDFYEGIVIGGRKSDPIILKNTKHNIIERDYIVSYIKPNPFNPTTTISYTLPKEEFVTIKIFNSNGKEVKCLVNENQEAGEHFIKFDGSSFTAGTYFYKIETKAFSKTYKMLLIK